MCPNVFGPVSHGRWAACRPDGLGTNSVEGSWGGRMGLMDKTYDFAFRERVRVRWCHTEFLTFISIRFLLLPNIAAIKYYF